MEPLLNDKKTANFRIVSDEKGNRYEFFCDLSNALVHTSEPVKADDPEEELMLAWAKGGKANFNKCKKCGKWVIDAMWNPDLWNCVQCSPIEDYPNYCPECGAKTSDPSYYCHICGTKLFLREENGDETAK